MNDGQHLTIKPTSGITPEQARDARARAWAYVFRCWQEKQKAAEPAPEPDGRNDVRKGQDAHTATQKCNG